MQILTECRLLKQEISGREIYYHLNPAKIKEAADWIEQFRELWEARLNHMERVLNNMKNQKIKPINMKKGILQSVGAILAAIAAGAVCP